MRILIASAGKFKSGPEQALYEHFVRRSSWKIELLEIDDKKSKDIESQKAREAELLLAASQKYASRIALDEKGKSLTSKKLAEYFSGLQKDGSVAFLIGGADGLHESVAKSCDLTLCLGTLTWPHLLVRGLIAEQIYRAESILKNHPYHRE